MKNKHLVMSGLVTAVFGMAAPAMAAVQADVFIGFSGDTSPGPGGNFLRNYNSDGSSLTQVSDNGGVGQVNLGLNRVGGVGIGDADNSGSPEVLVGYSDGTTANLRSYTYDGTTLTQKDDLWAGLSLSSFPVESIAVGNADNSLDGSNEVFVGFTSNTTNGFANRFLRSYNYSGGTLSQIGGDLWGAGGLGLGSYVPAGLGIGDVDNDGNNEVAIAFNIANGTDQRFIRFYDYDGTSLTQEGSGSLWVGAGLGNYQIDGIDVGDVDGDGDNEIVVGFKHKADATQRFARIFNYDGSILTSTDLGWSALHGSTSFAIGGIGVGNAVVPEPATLGLLGLGGLLMLRHPKR